MKCGIRNLFFCQTFRIRTFLYLFIMSHFDCCCHDDVIKQKINRAMSSIVTISTVERIQPLLAQIVAVLDCRYSSNFNKPRPPSIDQSIHVVSSTVSRSVQEAQKLIRSWQASNSRAEVEAACARAISAGESSCRMLTHRICRVSPSSSHPGTDSGVEDDTHEGSRSDISHLSQSNSFLSETLILENQRLLQINKLPPHLFLYHDHEDFHYDVMQTDAFISSSINVFMSVIEVQNLIDQITRNEIIDQIENINISLNHMNGCDNFYHFMSKLSQSTNNMNNLDNLISKQRKDSRNSTARLKISLLQSLLNQQISLCLITSKLQFFYPTSPQARQSKRNLFKSIDRTTMRLKSILDKSARRHSTATKPSLSSRRNEIMSRQRNFKKYLDEEGTEPTLFQLLDLIEKFFTNSFERNDIFLYFPIDQSKEKLIKMLSEFHACIYSCLKFETQIQLKSSYDVIVSCLERPLSCSKSFTMTQHINRFKSIIKSVALHKLEQCFSLIPFFINLCKVNRSAVTSQSDFKKKANDWLSQLEQSSNQIRESFYIARHCLVLTEDIITTDHVIECLNDCTNQSMASIQMIEFIPESQLVMEYLHLNAKQWIFWLQSTLGNLQSSLPHQHTNNLASSSEFNDAIFGQSTNISELRNVLKDQLTEIKTFLFPEREENVCCFIEKTINKISSVSNFVLQAHPLQTTEDFLNSVTELVELIQEVGKWIQEFMDRKNDLSERSVKLHNKTSSIILHLCSFTSELPSSISSFRSNFSDCKMEIMLMKLNRVVKLLAQLLHCFKTTLLELEAKSTFLTQRPSMMTFLPDRPSMTASLSNVESQSPHQVHEDFNLLHTP